MMKSCLSHNPTFLLSLSRDIGNVLIPYRAMMNVLIPQSPAYQAHIWIPTPMEHRGLASLASTCAESVQNYKYKTRRWGTLREEKPLEANFSRALLSM